MYTSGANGLGVPSVYNSDGWDKIRGNPNEKHPENYGDNIDTTLCPNSNAPNYIMICSSMQANINLFAI